MEAMSLKSNSAEAPRESPTQRGSRLYDVVLFTRRAGDSLIRVLGRLPGLVKHLGLYRTVGRVYKGSFLKMQGQ